MLNLQKGENLLLDLTKAGISRLDIGLGWDTKCDLDVYAVLRNDDKQTIDTVYFGNKDKLGVSLSGDNLTGDGDGDDEIIYLDLARVDKSVKYIGVYVNVFSMGSTFGDVKGSYIRLYEPGNGTVHAKSILDTKEYASSKSVHFAELQVSDKIDFKVIMEGSRENVKTMARNYAAQNGTNIEAPKKKKLFGLF